MHTTSISLQNITDFLHDEFSTDLYPANEQGGVYRSSERPIRRLGLALEPFTGLPKWAVENQIDALWLHRPWQIDMATLSSDVGILYHHLPFDETLTMGFNTRLSTVLGAIGALESLGTKQATNETGELLPQRSIGMLFDSDEAEFDSCLHHIKTTFGGYDRAEAGHSRVSQHTVISRVAVVGAMNDSLIREAADRGANLYLTGQYRKPAQEAVDETGIAVIAVGHRRTEEWGLSALADLLQKRWSQLSVVMHQ